MQLANQEHTHGALEVIVRLLACVCLCDTATELAASGMTPLMVAAVSMHSKSATAADTRCVTLLLDQGADKDAISLQAVQQQPLP